MKLTQSTLASRLLAGFGTAALLGAIGLFASRPAHTAGGPIPVSVANTPLATTAADMPSGTAISGSTKYSSLTALRLWIPWKTLGDHHACGEAA